MLQNDRSSRTSETETWPPKSRSRRKNREMPTAERGGAASGDAEEATLALSAGPSRAVVPSPASAKVCLALCLNMCVLLISW
ncbi:hypothetical protein BKA67DRAFT_576062 [Truncatella angustata]|uniref:Uncharacterized protein n=1 Tax=Truncatella angustata TaxID=152316 RepID=A0A9P8ZTB2_9PEZI|nr:uncharacterized protein BKA67DRAFT_576062 [Truncatella angustata]KAH6648860.1 hypothetical protein BKA67DRAFT_576062 [Truncatella angustata]